MDSKDIRQEKKTENLTAAERKRILEKRKAREREIIAENRQKASKNRNNKEQRKADLDSLKDTRKLADIRKERQDEYKLYKKHEDVRKKNVKKRLEQEKESSKITKHFKLIVITVLVLFVFVASIEFILPGTTLKKYDVIDDTPIEEKVSIIPTKEYAQLDGITEDQLLWNMLMEHFNNNKTATLGVMCNLKAESRFEAGNLEDYNNQLWNLNDDEYTEKVNRKTIGKDDFLESRAKNVSNGYYNGENQWVNKDGGYGYAQYTSYDKKSGLYQFAEQWFGPGGPGEEYKFNIGDPEMQAHYIIYLLDSNEYESMDSQIRNASTVVDACYIWLKKYEVPYDPYNDGYYTLSFDRAAPAQEIEAACTGGN